MSAEVPITVSVAPPLLSVTSELTRQAIGHDLAQLLGSVNVPSVPVVSLESHEPTAEDPALIRVRVGDMRCRFPAETIAAALSYVHGKPGDVRAPNVQALAEQLAPRADDPSGRRPHEFFVLICRSAVGRQLGVFPVDERMRVALDLGIPLDGPPAGVELADEAVPAEPGSADNGRSPERLIARLAAREIEVLIDPVYLRALTQDQDDNGKLEFMRDGLSVELGIQLPPFKFPVEPSLHPRAFAFRINRRLTTPRIGLSLGTILVNDTPQRLKLIDVDGEAATNPGTGLPAAIVSAEHQSMLEAGGLSTWHPFDYFILSFAAEVRRNAHALMTRDMAEEMVEVVGRAFPELAAAAADHAPPELLAPVLRELLEDSISIRNMRRILELVVRYQTADPTERPGDCVRFVRAGLGDAIAFKFARTTSTLVVYLLDPEIERAVSERHGQAEPHWPQDAVSMRLCAALREEMSHLPPTAQTPVLLTWPEVWRPVRQAVRIEFPTMVVLNYDDLPPDYNVQPVARLAWGS